MRKIAFFSTEGNGCDMALKFQKEGAEVRLWIKEKSCAKNFDGMVPKSKDWKADARWCDWVYFDDNGMEEQKKFVLDLGKPAFGMGHAKRQFTIGKEKFWGYECAEAMEQRRKMMQDLFKQLGIGEPFESLEFRDTAEALEHLKEHQVPHVIKPEIQGSGSEKTYVGEKDDNSDVLGWLETLPDRPDAGAIKRIEIEERIKGVEVGCSGLFNGTDWIQGAEINFEHKKIANGELGFNTGEMGTTIYLDPRPNDQVRLFAETVAKMTGLLRQFDYRGFFDLNCIITEKGLYVLEATPRSGYPASYITTEAERKGQLVPMFYSIACGHDYHHVYSSDWCIGVVLVGEGYPFWEEGRKRMDLMPILGITKENIDHFHLYDAKVFKDKLVCSGSYPMTATATGKTLKEAQQKVYGEVIPQVFFPSIYYRTDIGDKVFEALEKLNAWGWDVRNN